MPTLAEIYPRYASPSSWGDKGSVHSYIEVYDRLLKPYQARGPMNVLEIGILTGQSLLMWEEYFEDLHLSREAGLWFCGVWGVDCEIKPVGGMGDLQPLIDAGHKIKIMDATDPTQVQHHFGHLKFDVVIEDASHALEHQLKIYENFKPLMAPGSIYIIEDIENIDASRAQFEAIDSTKKVEIIDLRHVKGRFDDVLVVIT